MPTVGLEVDVTCRKGREYEEQEKEKDNKTGEENVVKKPEENEKKGEDEKASVDRVTLLQPFSPPRILYHHTVPPTRNIHIIMPLQGRLQSLQVGELHRVT